MKHRHLAARVALNSAAMILVVYVGLQIVTYLRDNIIFGTDSLASLVPSVASFVGLMVLPPALVFGTLLYLLALPLQRTERRLAGGEPLSPEEIERTRRRLLAFSRWVLAINLVGFAAGYVLSIAIQGRMGDILLMEGLVILSSNLSGGYVYATAQTSLNNLMFAELRERLGVRGIDGRRREMRSTARQILLSVMLAYYCLSFVQYHMHDFATAKAIESELLASMQSGSVSPADAEAEYRALMAARYPSFSTRSGFDPARLTPPWERSVGIEGQQERIFALLAAFILLIAAGVQVTASAELRSQLDALDRRIKDVVAGDGDLRLRVDLRKTDDIGELSGDINLLLDRFQAIVTRIGSAAEQTRAGAASITAVVGTSRSVSERAAAEMQALRADLERQADESRKLIAELEDFRRAFREVGSSLDAQRAFVEETSSAMAEMRSTIESVESITARSRALSETLAAQGEDGGRSAADTVSAMKDIDEAAGQVLSVLGTLKDIAASINLLAMNAAIEAAHAGEAGLGFAVVATEVRNLATTAADETRNIKQLIDAMGERVRVGVQRSGQTGEAFSDLVKGLGQAASLSGQIAEAMREQASGTRQVADTVVRVVDTSRAVGERMSGQAAHTDSMGDCLSRTCSRLQELAGNSRNQTENVRALEASLAAVSAEADKNLAAVENLTREIGNYKA